MRRLAAAVILVLLTAVPGSAQLEGYIGNDNEGWFSRDKRLHFGISAVGSAAIYVAGVEAGLPRWQSATLATGVMGALGVWREIGTTDRENLITREKVSRQDLVWDALGIGFGLAATELYYRAVRRTRERQPKALPVPAP